MQTKPLTPEEIKLITAEKFVLAFMRKHKDETDEEFDNWLNQ